MSAAATSRPLAPAELTPEAVAGLLDRLTERDGARTIHRSLLRPDLDDAFVEAGCRLAAEYDVASVCVRPADVPAGAITHAAGAIVGVILENAYLADEEVPSSARVPPSRRNE